MQLPGERVRLLASMPGYLASSGGSSGQSDGPGAAGEALGAKLVSVYPDNTARGLESHYGMVVLFDSETARLRSPRSSRM